MEVGLVLLALFTLGLFGKQVLQPEIILDPIGVPEDIARRGYTEIIVAEQLVDALETGEHAALAAQRVDALQALVDRHDSLKSRAVIGL